MFRALLKKEQKLLSQVLRKLLKLAIQQSMFLAQMCKLTSIQTFKSKDRKRACKNKLVRMNHSSQAVFLRMPHLKNWSIRKKEWSRQKDHRKSRIRQTLSSTNMISRLTKIEKNSRPTPSIALTKVNVLRICR